MNKKMVLLDMTSIISSFFNIGICAGLDRLLHTTIASRLLSNNLFFKALKVHPLSNMLRTYTLVATSKQAISSSANVVLQASIHAPIYSINSNGGSSLLLHSRQQLISWCDCISHNFFLQSSKTVPQVGPLHLLVVHPHALELFKTFNQISI